MNLEKLQEIYDKEEVVRAICDNMAERSRNQSETKLERILRHLNKDGYEVKRSGVIAAFRLLEEAGCGHYIEGRHGHKSRFAWSVKSMFVKDAITGEASAESVEEDDSFEGYEGEMIEHTYVLRSDFTVAIELPEDLTRMEANRLSQFIDTLSFDED